MTRPTGHTLGCFLAACVAFAATGPAHATTASDGTATQLVRAPSDARREIERLKDETTQESARLALRDLPAADVAGAISDAILTGTFRADTPAAFVAYDTLIARVADPEYSAALGPLSVGEPFLALVEGTTHASPYVRRIATKALGGARPEQRALVVAPLRDALASRDWFTVQNAAVALGRVGAPASAALDALLDLFRDPDADRRASFAAFAKSERAAGRSVHENLERSVRIAAALARTRIATPTVDLDLYRGLNDVGQDAAAVALVTDYQRRFYPAEGQTNSGPEASERAAQHAAVTSALVAAFENPVVPVSVRSDILRAVCGQLFFRDLAAPVKAASMQLLESAAAGGVTELKALADELRAEIARRAR